MTAMADDERPIALPSRLAERLTYLAFGLSSDMMTVTRLDDGCLVEANEAFYRVTGYSPEEAVGQSFTDLGLWVDPSTAKELAEALRENRSVSGFECELRARSGLRYAEELSAALVSLDGQAYMVGTYRDVTAKRLLEHELLRVAALVDASDDAIIGKSVDGVIQSWNRGAERIYGYSAWEVLGRSESVLDPPEADLSTRIGSVNEEGPHLEVVRRRKDGTLIDVSLTDSPITDRAGVLLGVSSIARDITERRQAEDLTRYLAYHDQLTGLANRALFEEHLDKALSRARRSHLAVAVLYLDMDNLKLVNDRLGHAAGDQLLVQMGERLHKVARQADSVARLGGDEFLVLLADLPPGVEGSFDEAVQASQEVASRIREQFQRPFRLADTELTATASIGISIYPIDAMDATALVRNADAAMFRSKETRKSEVMPEQRN
jgi:diguanylate cyclase (GGDEF)-like protein/PAS domain S-box-containing protein